MTPSTAICCGTDHDASGFTNCGNSAVKNRIAFGFASCSVNAAKNASFIEWARGATAPGSTAVGFARNAEMPRYTR